MKYKILKSYRRTLLITSPNFSGLVTYCAWQVLIFSKFGGLLFRLTRFYGFMSVLVLVIWHLLSKNLKISLKLTTPQLKVSLR